MRIQREFYADSAVPLQAPISPALHLGATRVLVIGVSGNPGGVNNERPTGRVPTLAQVGVHLLNGTFIDTLEGDIETLNRLNHLSAMVPEAQRREAGVRPVDVLLISPSRPLDEIAARHRRELPWALRLFLRGPGAMRSSGAGVLSYLLFEQGYCHELIRLGYKDAMDQRDALQRFLGLQEVSL
ncbi:MAG: hypothetical protein GAK43_01932 [Stenotrophomonas maltophilia]|nr:MAG: hypothetical protein GAK43_01932 [Stenotrophomonas maltophilia]